MDELPKTASGKIKRKEPKRKKSAVEGGWLW
jgi:acyl-coenzyme A synthetase/AMP-(fatty) acid ligase